MTMARKDWDLILSEYFRCGTTVRNFVNRYNTEHPDSTISVSNFHIHLKTYRSQRATTQEQQISSASLSNQVEVVDLAAIFDKPEPKEKETPRPNSSVLQVRLPNGITMSLATGDGVATMTGVLLGVIRGMR